MNFSIDIIFDEVSFYALIDYTSYKLTHLRLLSLFFQTYKVHNKKRVHFVQFSCH